MPTDAACDTLTLIEAAQRRGITIRAARRAAKAGEIPVICIGGRFLVLRHPFDLMVRRSTIKK